MSASFDLIRERLREMTEAEVLDLLELLAGRLREQRADRKARGRLGDLYGLGSEIWAGIDPVAYLREERASWDR